MRLRWLVVLVVFVFVVAGCGDDGESVETTDGPPADEPDEPGDAPDESDESDEPEDSGGGGDVPAQNYFTIDGEVYPITIEMCFQSPGVDLEVDATINGAAGSDAYAYMFAGEGSTDLTLSAFRVSDEASGLDWSNESGEGATNLAMADRGISGEVPVTSPDGGTATAVFDFVCPG